MAWFIMENGIYHPSTRGNVLCVLRHTDWCVMRHGSDDLRLAWISPFGLMFSDTGAKFPRTPLCLVTTGGAVMAEIGDFYIYRCSCPDLAIAAHTVADRVRSQLHGAWEPYLTDNSFYGESLTHFPGFRIRGGPVELAPDWRHVGKEMISDDPMRSVSIAV